MRVLDLGHTYELDTLDGGGTELLLFVKRNNPPEKFPGNKSAYPGTTIQEVMRAVIDRLKYVNNQVPCEETALSVEKARSIIWLLEKRAAQRHNRPFNILSGRIENQPTCPVCGHIGHTCSEESACT